jgi:hypothetical protein
VTKITIFLCKCFSGDVIIIQFLLFASIDATDEVHTGSRLGRLVNHDSKAPNAKMKVINIDEIQYLCLFATTDIYPHEEILYDYGVKHLPWEKKVSQIIFHVGYIKCKQQPIKYILGVSRI